MKRKKVTLKTDTYWKNFLKSTEHLKEFSFRMIPGSQLQPDFKKEEQKRKFSDLPSIMRTSKTQEWETNYIIIFQKLVVHYLKSDYSYVLIPGCLAHHHGKGYVSVEGPDLRFTSFISQWLMFINFNTFLGLWVLWASPTQEHQKLSNFKSFYFTEVNKTLPYNRIINLNGSMLGDDMKLTASP